MVYNQLVIFLSCREEMKMREKLFAFLLVLSLAAMSQVTFSQEPGKPSRQMSIDAFSKGDYEQAYKGFSQLLLNYPKDPLYKYYSAVSLVKMNRQPADAQKMLEQALAVPVKTLPADALFYLGRARQMQGDFSGAEEAYKAFSSKAGKKAAKELDLDQYLRESKMGVGKIAANESIQSTSVVGDNSKQVIAEAKKTESPVRQAEKLPKEVDKNMQNTLNQQYKADSLNSIASEKKKQTVLPIPESEQKNLNVSNDVQVKSNEPVIEKKDDKEGPVSRSVIESAETRESVSQDTDMTDLSSTLKQAGVFSVFEILPKPVTNTKEKIEINPSVPEGLIYRIQIAVFKNPVGLAYFKGITPIYGFKLSGSAVTTYYAGMFRRIDDASRAANAVKANGFKDAFVVGIFGGKPVSADRAAVLQKEWGNKPLFNVTRTDRVAENDTIPPTLVFRVEVMKSLKPLKEDVTENLRKLSGNHGMDIVTLNDGSTTYLVGNFITFESADQYAALLVRNGYRDAHVVAWLGQKEIDVDTARKLFENLK
jgi:tetratricopeptide (TPR) repeat protein